MASSDYINPMYERRAPDQSTWKGRLRKHERCVNSFAEFLANARRSKEGKAHLQRHHGGYTGTQKSIENIPDE